MKVRLLNISIFPPVRECVPQEITQSLAVYSEFFGDFVHRAFLIDHFLDDIFFSGQPDLHGLFAFRTTEFRAFRFLRASASRVRCEIRLRSISALRLKSEGQNFTIDIIP